MKQIYNLDAENKVKEVFNSLYQKNVHFSKINRPLYTSTDEDRLFEILNILEPKIHYVVDSPAYEYNGRNYVCEMFELLDLLDLNRLLSSNSENFLVIYILKILDGNSFSIRGNFIFDKSAKRDFKIDQIIKLI